MRRLGPLVLVAMLLAGCGGGSNTVAHVGGETITKGQLDTVVEHFRNVAKSEGTEFPAEGSAAFRRIQSRLVGLLVYRTELRQAARRLGVRVARVQVLKSMGSGGGGEEEGPSDAFDYGSAETQLLYAGIFRKVTRDVHGPTRAELAARRNQAMSRYVTRLRRDTKVRYEPGYAPGS
jgi:hypothetical protein